MIKRYFERSWEGEYYIFDSETISEKEFDEKVQYEDYKAFEDSLNGDEVVELLNNLDVENRDLSHIGEKQAKFIQSKGFTFKEFIEFLKEDTQNNNQFEGKRFENHGRIITDNKTKLNFIMTLEWEVSLVTRLLNQLHDENQSYKQSDNIADLEVKIAKLNDENLKIKNTIREGYAAERTVMGKSVLKQLADNLGVEL